ncbi:MAG: PaaI family thioesterase [Oscillospiraceae bacterium]|jgi:acyl-CoA thioesterase|nr:PaaI family thioesterase [Oscillospiraceae bacterium]
MTLEEARAFFLSTDRFASEALGAQIDAVGIGSSKVSLDILPIHKRVGSAVMGGVYFTLADFAFAVATNDEHTRVVSLSSTINFHRQPRGQRMSAFAQVEWRGKTILSCTVQVAEADGSLLATMLVTGYVTQRGA